MCSCVCIILFCVCVFLLGSSVQGWFLGGCFACGRIVFDVGFVHTGSFSWVAVFSFRILQCFCLVWLRFLRVLVGGLSVLLCQCQSVGYV